MRRLLGIILMVGLVLGLGFGTISKAGVKSGIGDALESYCNQKNWVSSEFCKIAGDYLRSISGGCPTYGGCKKFLTDRGMNKTASDNFCWVHFN